MNSRLLLGASLVLCVCLAPLSLAAQESAAAPAVVAASRVVPRLINYSGVLKDSTGSTLTSLTGVTFLLYKDEQGGAPLWLETQNISPDRDGRYNVELGAASKDGIPPDLFMNGEARWLAVQISSEPEQARVLLVPVPYAMKAVDAQTLGGLPPSAFVLAAPPTSNETASGATTTPSASLPSLPPPGSAVTTNGGTTNTLSMFTGATTIGNAIVTQTGTTAINVNGKLNLPATGTATSAAGFNSRPLDLSASSFSKSIAKAVTETFQWQAEPVGNNTATPSGTLNLLFGANGTTPAETGLKINNNGQFIFAAGQTFPGSTITGSETINGNLSATNLTATSVVFGQLGSFTGSNAGNILIAQNQNSSGGIGIVGNSSGSSGIGMEGNAFGSGGTGVQGSGATGVLGTALTTFGTGVSGTSSGGTGVLGQGTGSGSIGVFGKGQAEGLVAFALAPKGNTQGVFASASSPTGTGTFSLGGGESKTAQALAGCCSVGAWGDTNQIAAGAAGLVGTADDAQALFLQNNSATHLTANINNTENTAHNVAIMNVQGAFGSCNADSDGDLACTGKMKSHNLVTTTTATNMVEVVCASPSCAFATMPNMSLSVNTGSVVVLIAAQVGGIFMADCAVMNIDLFVDGSSVDHTGIEYGATLEDHATLGTATLTSIQSLAQGSHTVAIEWNLDTSACSGSQGIAFVSERNSTRSLTVVELVGTLQ